MAARVTFRVDERSLARFQDELESRLGDMEDEFEMGTQHVLGKVGEESQRLCPYDSSPDRPASRGVHLRDTMRIHVGRRKGHVTGNISYNKAYAQSVHEIPARHKAPTTWKFLEIPWTKRRAQIEESIRNAARRALKAR